MGATSHSARPTVRLNGPSRAKCSGGFFVVRSTARLNCPAQAGTGDPDPGARAETRVPKCAGPAGGNEAMSRTPMAERTPRSSQSAAHRQRREEIFQNGLPHHCGSTDAGGEDVGYFAPLERAGSNPACDTRTGMRPGKGPRAAPRSLSSARRAAVLSSLTPISPVPQRTYRRPAQLRWSGGGEDDCYFVGRRYGAERVRGRTPKGGSPARAATASLVPRRPLPRPVVKIAVTSSVKREVAGSNPARCHVHR